MAAQLEQQQHQEQLQQLRQEQAVLAGSHQRCQDNSGRQQHRSDRAVHTRQSASDVEQQPDTGHLPDGYDKHQQWQPPTVHPQHTTSTAAAERLRAAKAAVAKSQQIRLGAPGCSKSLSKNGTESPDSAAGQPAAPLLWSSADVSTSHPKCPAETGSGKLTLGRHRHSVHAAGMGSAAAVKGNASDGLVPGRNVLNEQEVDVVLQLLGALHGAK